MEPVRKVSGRIEVLDRADVDTDQIIPKQFLKRIERSGFGEFLFYDWRKEGLELERGRPILVAGRNFGCGSSREHAPWSLLEYGFRSIIAPSYADIFYNNCFKNGILPIVLPEETVNALMQKAKANLGHQLTVDLESQTISDSDGLSIPFDVDPFRKHLLLNGLDDIGLTLQHEPDITAYESTRPSWKRGTAAAA